MGDVHAPQPVLLLLAAFSAHASAIDWARRRVADTWGTLAMESEHFDFSQTSYYQSTMGSELKKVFFALAEPIDPGRLAEIKLTTNRWEEEYAAAGRHEVARPLNLDPGYVSLGKLVLASTKDHAHRIYLADGIYAEITLFYQHRAWRSHRWTFADYQREDYQQFFSECRAYLHKRLRAEDHS